MRAWPKLLGVNLAVFAVGFLMFSVGDLFRMGLFTGSPFVIGFLAWFVFGLSCFLLILSYPLYRAYNWARLVLFAAALFAFVVVLVSSAYDVTRQHLAVDGDATKITPQEIRSIRREELILRSMSAGSAIVVLSPLALLLCVLLQPDVATAFRKPHIRRDTTDT